MVLRRDVASGVLQDEADGASDARPPLGLLGEPFERGVETVLALEMPRHFPFAIRRMLDHRVAPTREPNAEFLLELGAGFAFVGRQVLVDVGGEEFFIDLLFYHLKLRCYVVIELKTGKFKALLASDQAGLAIKPVVRLQARVLQIHSPSDTVGVGYGLTHRTAGPARLATLGVGYGDVDRARVACATSALRPLRPLLGSDVCAPESIFAKQEHGHGFQVAGDPEGPGA